MSGETGPTLTRDDLVSLLGEVGAILQAKGLEASLYVVGGAAMSLVYDSRRTTRDVDASIRSDRRDLDEASAIVAAKHGLEPTWINSRAVAFLSNEPDRDEAEITLPGLRIAVASAEHLIAMKIRAARDRDLADLDFLFRHLGLTSPEQAADIHEKLFDDTYIGGIDYDEARYVAQVVFDRAENDGNPIRPEETRQPPPQQSTIPTDAGDMHWVEPHSRAGRPVKGHWRRNPGRS